MANLSKDLTAASSIPVILSILSRGESYGYAIIQQVHMLSDGKVSWTDGMLYPVLHKLEKRGLIRSEWRVAEETGRRRRYYQVTEKGLAALRRERENWSLINGILGKLWQTE